MKNEKTETMYQKVEKECGCSNLVRIETVQIDLK